MCVHECLLPADIFAATALTLLLLTVMLFLSFSAFSRHISYMLRM